MSHSPPGPAQPSGIVPISHLGQKSPAKAFKPDQRLPVPPLEEKVPSPIILDTNVIFKIDILSPNTMAHFSSLTQPVSSAACIAALITQWVGLPWTKTLASKIERPSIKVIKVLSGHSF